MSLDWNWCKYHFTYEIFCVLYNFSTFTVFYIYGHWFITCLCTSFQTASSKSLGKKWHTQSFKVTISIIYYMDYKTFHLEESFILLIFIITFCLYIYIKISNCIHFFHPLQISNSYNTACVFNVSVRKRNLILLLVNGLVCQGDHSNRNNYNK